MATRRMTSDASYRTAAGAAAEKTVRSRILDPLDRASEILFALIMVLTFTLSIAATEAGREDVRTVLIGALGCNLAWGIIDAVMYVMGVQGERRIAASALAAIRKENDPVLGRALVADQLPPVVRGALTEAELERIRFRLRAVPESIPDQAWQWSDLLAACGVFLLVFLCVFPVVLPVRRQIIWRSLGLGLAEYRPRLWVDVMRRACGAASADAGWFV
ncbi:hypothetical protein, partial [Devosia faecipullorum]|uniref:hypothetical protein n=1 Tax=Devosia faecipullorum TaxID=2755039 RepID=UPI00187B65AE